MTQAEKLSKEGPWKDGTRSGDLGAKSFAYAGNRCILVCMADSSSFTIEYDDAAQMWNAVLADDAMADNDPLNGSDDDPTRPTDGCRYSTPQRIGINAPVKDAHKYQASIAQQSNDIAHGLYKQAMRTMTEIPLCPCYGLRVELHHVTVSGIVHLVLHCPHCTGEGSK